MAKSASNVRKDISAFRLDTNFIALRQRMQTDFDLYRLKPYDPGPSYTSYTTNDPRVFADKIISMLNMAKLIIRTPDEILAEDDRKIASNCERLLYGAYNLNDERLLRSPSSPRLRARKAWHSSIRGGFGTRAYVYKDENGATQIDIAIFDLYNMAYGLGNDGRIAWATHSTFLTPAEVTSRYKDTKVGTSTQTTVEVVEYWDTERHGVLINNQWVAESSHSVGHCPVYIFRNEDMPNIWQENYTFANKFVGESIYAPNRDIYPTVSKTLSDHVTLVRRGVKVPMGYWSQTGDKTLPTDIWQTEKAAAIALTIGEDIKPLIPQTMPNDTTPLLNWVSGEVQRGSLPYTAYGSLGFRLSGFAINQLQGSMESVITPMVNSMENSYMMECYEILQQYAKGSWKPVKVLGRTSRNQPFGYPNGQDIKPSDIRDDWRIEVSLVPVLPKDDAQKFELALRARDKSGGEVPLLSDRHIRSRILEIEDPDLEDDIINYEWANQLIINRLYDAYMFAVVEERNQDKAANILVELKRVMAETGAGPSGGGGRRGPDLSGLNQMAAESPGAGMPSGPTGMSSGTMPSEAMGGMPGGAMNAQMPLFGGI